MGASIDRESRESGESLGISAISTGEQDTGGRVGTGLANGASDTRDTSEPTYARREGQQRRRAREKSRQNADAFQAGVDYSGFIGDVEADAPPTKPKRQKAVNYKERARKDISQIGIIMQGAAMRVCGVQEHPITGQSAVMDDAEFSEFVENGAELLSRQSWYAKYSDRSPAIALLMVTGLWLARCVDIYRIYHPPKPKIKKIDITQPTQRDTVKPAAPDNNGHVENIENVEPLEPLVGQPLRNNGLEMFDNSIIG